MIEDVVNRASQELRCADQLNRSVGIKLDNAAYMGVRKLYTDQIANTVSKSIKAGSILTIEETGDTFIVGTLTTDYFKGRFIRNVIDLLETNNKVTVTLAEVLLGTSVTAVHYMPDSAFDTSLEDVGVGKWKAAKCVEIGVVLMVDDLTSVIDCCDAAGIATIQVHLKD